MNLVEKYQNKIDNELAHLTNRYRFSIAEEMTFGLAYITTHKLCTNNPVHILYSLDSFLKDGYDYEFATMALKQYGAITLQSFFDEYDIPYNEDSNPFDLVEKSTRLNMLYFKQDRPFKEFEKMLRECIKTIQYNMVIAKINNIKKNNLIERYESDGAIFQIDSISRPIQRQVPPPHANGIIIGPYWPNFF